MILILMGENPKCFNEIKLAVENNIPIIVVDGS
jgi:hypothetical protein